jgi:GMP synthase-like glutamine amidotransferase
MNKEILIINTCKEKLHYLEFVRPIEEIVASAKKKFFTQHYSKINVKDLMRAEKIIICGTALKDFEYDREMMAFSWLRGFEKPVLGICAGMQILVKIFDGNIVEKKEIGLIQVKFDKDFLGIEKGKEVEVYALHKFGIHNLGENFEVCGKSKNQIQAIKMNGKEFYGVMFHPEARNREIVKAFCLL